MVSSIRLPKVLNCPMSLKETSITLASNGSTSSLVVSKDVI